MHFYDNPQYSREESLLLTGTEGDGTQWAVLRAGFSQVYGVMQVPIEGRVFYQLERSSGDVGMPHCSTFWGTWRCAVVHGHVSPVQGLSSVLDLDAGFERKQ